MQLDYTNLVKVLDDIQSQAWNTRQLYHGSSVE